VSGVDVVLPHKVSAVADARRGLAAYLKRRAVSVEARDDAQLVLTELLSNAIRHAWPLAAGEVRAAWWLDQAGIHLEVTDGGSDTDPRRITDAHPESIGGRGLAIVDGTGLQWGAERHARGKTVWVQAPLQA